MFDINSGFHTPELWKKIYPANTKEDFLVKDYEALISENNTPVELIGGIHIEACGDHSKNIDEAKWVDGQLD